MRVLDLITMIATGLMVGNEFAVSAFANPAIWKHKDRPQAGALAARLGAAMPPWYGLCAVLLIAEVVVRRHSPSAVFFWLATGIWIIVIVFTVTTLVPINNRLARMPVEKESHDPAARPYDWLGDHHRWDRLHRVRVVLLTLAFGCFGWAVLGG